jgi:hypothetical protein
MSSFMATLMADAGGLLKFETSLLVLVIVGLIVLAKMLLELRAEVQSLREGRGAGARSTGEKPSQVAAAGKPADNDVPPDVFAAIVSAVYFTIGENVQIVSVRPSEAMAWSREGRRSIFRSHSFR